MSLARNNSGVLMHPLGKAALLVGLASVAAIAAAQFAPSELAKAMYVGTATLVFGGLLGGVLKLLLDDVAAAKREREDELAAARRRREDAATFVRNVLNDLKSVYDRVGRSRILIPAHRSAKTYGDEMRDLIQAGVQLRNVARALHGRPDGISTRGTLVRQHVNSMDDYLQRVTSEFSEHYKPISDLQRAYETRVDTAFARLAATDSDGPVTVRNTVWEALEALPVLQDFLSGRDGSEYRRLFETPLDIASGLLREELSDILGATGTLTSRAAEAAKPSEREDRRTHTFAPTADAGRQRDPAAVERGYAPDVERRRAATADASARVGADSEGDSRQHP